MDRAVRLRSLWSWLPAFRVVAETEHLPSASATLHVSASSLSRTIRLLEDDVGQPLFDRVGRSLVLNAAGRDLLKAVRRAMRSVDESLVRLGPGTMFGEVRIAVPAPFAPIYVLPALAELMREHPHLEPRVLSLPTPAINDALRQGHIDVGVNDAPFPADDVTHVELCPLQHAVCCGPGHPLFGKARVKPDEIAAHPFVAPTPIEGGVVPDRWPADRPRTIGLFVSQLQVGLDACASGAYLAVLPWSIGERAGLHRLPMKGIAPSRLYACHRPSLDPEGRTEAVIEALEAAAAVDFG